MKTIKTLLILILCSGSIYAQDNSGEIHGTLLEIDTKDPMQYSNVYVKRGERKIGSSTNENGKFIIKPLQSGTYNVYYMNLDGEERLLLEGINVKPNKIAFANNLLTSDNMLVECPVIWWEKPLINPLDPSAQTLDAKEISQSVNIRNPKAMLANMDSSIKLDLEGNISFRGARQNNVIYMVDGVKTTNMNMPGAAYESITAYAGGLPAKYGDTTGGVVIVESKSYFDYYRVWRAQQTQNNK